MRKIAAVMVAALAALHSPSMAGEEMLSAFSVWDAKGAVVKTGPNEATYIAVLEGTVYVDTEEGPGEAGEMVCPVTVRLDTTSRRQSATGKCTVTSSDGTQLFAELTCKGVHLVGCSGDMSLIGGTGRFDKVTGGGAFTIRSSLQTIALTSPAGAEQAAQGIIYLPQLRYVLP